MVQPDGISDEVISSNQTVDIKDIEEDDSFDTDMIVEDDDDEDDDGLDDDDDNTTDSNSTKPPIDA